MLNLLHRPNMNRIENIKYLIMDVDGTLTDGKIYVGNAGEMMKAFDVKDGYGIHDIAIPNGLVPVIMSGRNSKIVENRCRELGIEMIYQGVFNKAEKLLEITHQLNSVAYIGDDLNDLQCMKSIRKSGGIVGCPNNAVKQIQEISNFVAQRDGGNGAVREFIEWLLDK